MLNLTNNPIYFKNQTDLTIQPPASRIALTGSLSIPGDKSISHRALMLGALARGETQIQGLLLGEDVISTAKCLRSLGTDISDLTGDEIVIRGGLGQLQEPLDVLDAGNSGTTMRLMLGILAAQPNCFFTLSGDRSLRSRPMSGVVKPLTQMGATIWGRQNNKSAPLAIKGKKLRHSSLQGIEIAGELTVRSIDEIPIIIVAAAFAKGTTVIKDAAELRVKECDRLSVMATQLSYMGAKITSHPDGLEIQGGYPLSGAEVASHDDHRIAMSLAVAALRASGKTIIQEASAANISYPNFFDSLQQICSVA